MSSFAIDYYVLIVDDGVPKRGGFGGVTVRRDDGRSCAAALGVGVRAGVRACVGVALDDPVPLRVGVDLELVRASSRELANALAAATLVTALFSRVLLLDSTRGELLLGGAGRRTQLAGAVARSSGARRGERGGARGIVPHRVDDEPRGRARVLARHEPAHRLAPALSHRGGELRGAVPGRRVSRHPVRRAAGALGLWVRLVREFSVMIDCRADSDDEVAAQTQKAMRWWALAGRRWRPNDRAHHLPWRRASSSSSILGDDRGTCLYTLLGLDPRGDATLAQVKSAFKRRARAVHPDAAGVNRVAPGPDADDATDAFVRVVAAYEILSCERRRAAYDATRRSPSFMRGASASSSSSSSSSGSHGFAASPFADSEVLRDYAASIDALVPRWKLRDELYGALAHVIHGAELDVEDVHAGDSFPRYFEAEERTLRTFITENTGTTTTRGVDLMHVVAGRTLLAAVREHTDAELTDGREAVAGLLDSYNDDEDDEDGSKREEGRVDAADNATTMATDGRPDARLELVVGGRVVATATRSVRGGDVVVRDSAFCIDSSLGTEPNANATSRTRPEASLLKADVNNWGGHPRAGTKANPT